MLASSLQSPNTFDHSCIPGHRHAFDLIAFEYSNFSIIDHHFEWQFDLHTLNTHRFIWHESSLEHLIAPFQTLNLFDVCWEADRTFSMSMCWGSNQRGFVHITKNNNNNTTDNLTIWTSVSCKQLFKCLLGIYSICPQSGKLRRVYVPDKPTSQLIVW